MKLDASAFVAAPELIQALERHSTAISCADARLLFSQGELPVGLYILNAGEITLSMASPKGETVMQVKASAGSVLGLPGLIANQPYTLTATALGGAQLSFVSREEFSRLMQTDAQMALKILQVLAAEVRSARHALSVH